MNEIKNKKGDTVKVVLIIVLLVILIASMSFTVYDKFIVNPDELECTSQLTNGNKEITLITCTNDNKQRHIIKARVM